MFQVGLLFFADAHQPVWTRVALNARLPALLGKSLRRHHLHQFCERLRLPVSSVTEIPQNQSHKQVEPEDLAGLAHGVIPHPTRNSTVSISPISHPVSAMCGGAQYCWNQRSLGHITLFNMSSYICSIIVSHFRKHWMLTFLEPICCLFPPWRLLHQRTADTLNKPLKVMHDGDLIPAILKTFQRFSPSSLCFGHLPAPKSPTCVVLYWETADHSGPFCSIFLRPWREHNHC